MAARLYLRRFLNLPEHHAGAYILAEVQETALDDDVDTTAEVTLVLTDCTRQVSFDFPLWGTDDRRNSVHKARLLARELTRFADAVEVEARLIDRRKARDAAPAPTDEPVRPAAPSAEADGVTHIASAGPAAHNRPACCGRNRRPTTPTAHNRPD
jgi:hypothetical protein